MDGLGYVPVCSSSSMSKTCKDHVYGITAPFFGIVRAFCLSVENGLA